MFYSEQKYLNANSTESLKCVYCFCGACFSNGVLIVYAELILDLKYSYVKSFGAVNHKMENT